MTRLVVGWEDQFGGTTAQFGPHELLLSCVADRLDWDFWVIRDLAEPHPKKGNGNLHKWCRKVEATRGNTFAVFDSDRLHDLLGCPGDTPLAGMLTALRLQLDPVRVHVIERRVETLVEAAATLLELPIPPKTRLERDGVLNKLAWLPMGAERRVQLCARVPTFHALVEDVASALDAVGRPPGS